MEKKSRKSQKSLLLKTKQKRLYKVQYCIGKTLTFFLLADGQISILAQLILDFLSGYDEVIVVVVKTTKTVLKDILEGKNFYPRIGSVVDSLLVQSKPE